MCFIRHSPLGSLLWLNPTYEETRIDNRLPATQEWRWYLNRRVAFTLLCVASEGLSHPNRSDIIVGFMSGRGKSSLQSMGKQMMFE